MINTKRIAEKLAEDLGGDASQWIEVVKAFEIENVSEPVGLGSSWRAPEPRRERDLEELIRRAWKDEREGLGLWRGAVGVSDMWKATVEYKRGRVLLALLYRMEGD